MTEFQAPNTCPGLSPGQLRELILPACAAALDAVAPGRLVRDCLWREGDSLFVRQHPSLGPNPPSPIDLRGVDRLLVVAAGKAAVPMATAAEAVLGERITAGIAVTKHGAATGGLSRIEARTAGHPVPDEDGVAAGAAIRTMVEAAGPRDLVLCLISGGGSALLTCPVGNVTLADIQDLTPRLLASGASIREINRVRRRLDALKGGGLAALAAPARVVSLILSDVIGDPLADIASGPTVAVRDEREEAYATVGRRLGFSVSGAVQAAILWDRPVPAVPAENHLVGSNRVAAAGAAAALRAAGFDTVEAGSAVEGEAAELGAALAGVAQQLRHLQAQGPRLPRALVLGGEATVTLAGPVGRGGRNVEAALAAAIALDGAADMAVVCLATDGDDGNSGAAGAIATGATAAAGRAAGLEPALSLGLHDAATFFEAAGGLLVTGPTGTNVNDLSLVLVW